MGVRATSKIKNNFSKSVQDRAVNLFGIEYTKIIESGRPTESSRIQKFSKRRSKNGEYPYIGRL